jgi:hypothetical protein
MVLDALVKTPELAWLGTTDEKMHLTAVAAMDPANLPRVAIGEGDKQTIRYFPERLPIGIDREGRGVLLYGVTDPTLDEFRVFLEGYAPLLRALREWTLRIVAPPSSPTWDWTLVRVEREATARATRVRRRRSRRADPDRTRRSRGRPPRAGR